MMVQMWSHRLMSQHFQQHKEINHNFFHKRYHIWKVRFYKFFHWFCNTILPPKIYISNYFTNSWTWSYIQFTEKNHMILAFIVAKIHNFLERKTIIQTRQIIKEGDMKGCLPSTWSTFKLWEILEFFKKFENETFLNCVLAFSFVCQNLLCS